MDIIRDGLLPRLQETSIGPVACLERCAGFFAETAGVRDCFILAANDKSYAVVASCGSGTLADIGPLFENLSDTYDFAVKDGMLCAPITVATGESALELDRRQAAGQKTPRGFLIAPCDEGGRGADFLAGAAGAAFCGLLCTLIEMHQVLLVASTDKLTGALNRKYMDAALSDNFDEAVRTNNPFSVIMIDLDYFKHVNDTYGHLVGDDVLRATADIVRSCLNKGDVFGRYGGEEFIAMIKGDAAAARVMAEKIRTGIFGAKILGNKRDITASLGVAAFPEHADTAKTLVDRADKALYRAKQTGRNKHEVWAQDMAGMVVKKNREQEFFSGDSAKDAARMQSLYNLMQIAALELPLPEKLRLMLEEIYTTISATDVTLFSNNGGTLENTLCAAHGAQTPAHYNNIVINDVFKSGNPACLVDWENADASEGLADWRSIAVVPAVFARNTKAILYAAVSVKIKEFKEDETAFLQNAAIIVAGVMSL